MFLSALAVDVFDTGGAILCGGSKHEKDLEQRG